MLPTDPHEDWLQMPADQGARRFGPLPDRVRIGSDPSCEIVLAAHLGLPPVAIELRRNERRAWTVEHTSQPPWPCEIARPQPEGEPPVPGRPVRSGSRFAPGEAVVLSAIGAMPRFTLLRTGPLGPDPLPDEPNDVPEVDRRVLLRLQRSMPAEVPTEDDLPVESHDVVRARPGGVGGYGMGGAIASEAMRQASSRVLARSGTAREIDRLRRLGSQGAWRSPYFIVGSILMVLSLLLGGVASWMGWLGRLWGS